MNIRAKAGAIRQQLLDAGLIRGTQATTTAVPKIREARPKQPLSVSADPAQSSGSKKVSSWLYASLETLHPKGKASIAEDDGGPGPDAAPRKSNVSEDELNQLLLDNPKISAATLINLLKSKGFVVTRSAAAPKTEADASSANLAVQRESSNSVRNVQSSTGNLSIRAHFREASSKDDGIGPTRFRVVLLQEGLGNLKDGYFYTKESLQSALAIFEGKKIYADHPTSQDEEIRPERSVRDILGHFEDLKYEEAEGGQGELTGDVVIMPDKPYEWARALMRHSVEFAKKFPDKEFVGLSINASGEAEPVSLEEIQKGASESVALKLVKAKEQGLEQVKKVTKITEAVSCDLVTEAGAGGKVLQMLEIEKQKETQMSTKVKAAKAAVKTKEAEDAAAAKDVKAKDEKAAADKGAETDEADDKGDGAEGGDGKKAEAHDDESADKALIKKMLDEYVGAPKEGDHSEEMYQAGMEAVGAAKESGMSAEEAHQCAGNAMKMAGILNQKKTKEAAEAAKDDEGSKDDKAADSKETDTEESANKESGAAVTELTALKAKVIKLEGINAALAERTAKADLDKAIDDLLRESKLPMSVTKKFRETITSLKTKAEVESRLKSFREAYELGRGGEATNDFGLSVQPEKGAALVEGDGKDSMSFADCVEN